MMAARVADELRAEEGVEVELVKGGLGEFSVSIDGQKEVATTRFLYPRPSKVAARVRALLQARRAR